MYQLAPVATDHKKNDAHLRLFRRDDRVPLYESSEDATGCFDAERERTDIDNQGTFLNSR